MKEVDELKKEIYYGFKLNLPVLCYGKSINNMLDYMFSGSSYLRIDSSEIFEFKQLIGNYAMKEGIKYQKGILYGDYDIIVFTNVHENINLLYFLEGYLEKVKKKILLTSEVYYNLDYTINTDSYTTINKDVEVLTLENIESIVKEFIRKEENRNIENRQLFYEKVVYKISHMFIATQEEIKKYLKRELLLEEELIIYNKKDISVSWFKKDYLKTLIKNGIFEKIAPTKPVISTLINFKTILEREKGVLLVGDTGTGKTSLIQEFSKIIKKDDLIVLNCSADTDIQDLIGYYKIADKQFEYKKSLFLDCIENGKWILLDEINLCQDHVLKFLEAIMLKKSIYNFDLQKEIKFHAEFKLFAGMNDKGKKHFEGRGFKKIYFDDFLKDKDDIRLVISHLFSINSKLILKYKNDVNVHDSVKQEKDILCNKFNEFFIKYLSNSINKNNKNNISGRILSRIILNSEDIKDLYNLCDLLLFSKLSQEDLYASQNLLKQYFPVNVQLNEYKSTNKFYIDKITNMNLNRINLALKKDLPVLLYGDTSSGKTSLVYYLSEINKIKTYRINNHENTETSDYFGFYISKKEESFSFIFQPGTLVKALKEGSTLLLDELNLAPTEILESLNRLLDDNKELYVNELGIIKPHANFKLIATQNENYAGRKILSTAFRNRFVEIPIFQKNIEELREILINHKNIPHRFTNFILNIYGELQSHRSLNCLITLRDIFKWIKRDMKDIRDLIIHGLLLIRERQRTEKDILIIENTFKKEAKKHFKYENICIKELFTEYINTSFMHIKEMKYKNYFFSEDHKRLYVCVNDCLKNKENVLIIGRTGIGKTKIIEFLAENNIQNYITVNFNGNIEASDFIGQFKIENLNIKFVYGPVINAMKNGSILLLDEINLCPDSVLERLNSILDSRTLYLTETNEEIIAHPDFKIISTMNPGNDFGKKELSPALRNRFTEIYFNFTKYKEIFESFNFNMEIIQEVLNNSVGNRGDITLESLEDISIRKIERCHRFLKELETYKIKTNEKYKIALVTSGLIKQTSFDVSAYPFQLKRNAIWFHNFKIQRNNFFVKENNETQKKVKIEKEYNFKTYNCFQLTQALILNDPILLEGAPGVGKTSLLIEIAKYLQIKYLRINLSESTEFSDFTGSIDLKTLKFVPSVFVDILKQGGLIILDEINLCNQNVLEGLNALLDYRKSININGEEIKSKGRIIATMNPINKNNNRKLLPKSFLDRFIKLEFKYTENEIRNILQSTKYYKLGYSLRDCIKIEKLGENLIKKLMPKYSKKGFQHYYAHDKVIKLKTQKPIKCDLNFLKENSTDYIFLGQTEIRLPTNFVLLSPWLAEIEIFFRCLYFNIPIILMNNFYSKYLIELFKTNHFFCNTETEITDFIGDYERILNNSIKISEMFEFKYSKFIDFLQEESLLIIHFPDKVNPAIFDRLNSIFDNKTFQFSNEEITVKCRIILIIDELNLSPAVFDRCVYIGGDKEITKIENLRFFGESCGSYLDFKLKINDNILWPFKNTFIRNNEFDFFLEFIKKNEKENIPLKLWLLEKKEGLREADYISNTSNIEFIRELNEKTLLKKTLKIYKGICLLSEQTKEVFNNFIRKKIHSIYHFKLQMILFILGFHKEDDYEFIIETDIEDLEEIHELKYRIKLNEFLKESYNLIEPPRIKTKGIERILTVLETEPLFFKRDHLLTTSVPKKILKAIINLYKYGKQMNTETINKYLNKREEKRKDLKETELRLSRDYSFINNLLLKLNNEDGQKKILNSLNEEFEDILPVLKLIAYHKVNKPPEIRNYVTEILEKNSDYEFLINDYTKSLNSISKDHISNSFSKLLFIKSYSEDISTNTESYNRIDEKIKEELEAEFMVETILIRNNLILCKEYLNESDFLEIMENTRSLIPEKYLQIPIDRMSNIFKKLSKTSMGVNLKDLIVKSLEVNPVKNIENYTNFTYLAILTRRACKLQEVEEFLLNNTVSGFYESMFFIKEVATKENPIFSNCIIGSPVLQYSIQQSEKSITQFYNFSLIYHHLIFKIEKLFEGKNKKKKNEISKEDKILFKQHITNFIKDIKVDKLISTKETKCYETCKTELTMHLEINNSESKCLCEYLMTNKSRTIFGIKRLRRFKFDDFFLREIPVKEKYTELEVFLGTTIFVYLKLHRPEFISPYIDLLIYFPSIPLCVYLLNRMKTEENSKQEDVEDEGIGEEIDDGESCSKSENAEEISCENDGEFSNQQEDDVKETEGVVNEENIEGVTGDDNNLDIEELNDINEACEDIKEEGEVVNQDIEMNSEELSEYSEVSEYGSSTSMEEESNDTGDNREEINEGVNEGEEVQKYEFKEMECRNNQGGGEAKNYDEMDVGLESNEDKGGEDHNVEEEINSENSMEEGVQGISEKFKEKDLKSLKIQPESIKGIEKLDTLKIQLQSVLLNNKASKYAGGFSTGKKINIKKIIPFLASNFTQDKIWQRRNQKNKKEYKFNIFMDNSQSMNENYGDFLKELFKLIEEFIKSLEELNIDFEIYKFSNSLEKMEEKTNLKEFFDFTGISTSIEFISEFSDNLNIIFTDGIFQHLDFEIPDPLKTLLIIFDKNESLKNLENVNFIGEKIFKSNYLATLPFKFCLIEEENEIVDFFVQQIGEFYAANLN